ncbi:MAG: NUDIX domain-containing protein [Thermoplasmataceae archaeon]|jgi:ADP-ribose pyrophosphatase YjhB (NUDIX family)|nr:MAG: NTP pyrophosphohydrolase (MutT-related oxidative damage repair enzyme) [Thermoplasmatales archaeon E-plasma]
MIEKASEKKASVALVFHKSEFILLKRKKRDNDPWSGDYCLPGGFSKNVETLKETAKREFEEETGINSSLLEYIQSMNYFEPMKGIGVKVYPFVFSLKEKKELKIGDEIEWGSFENITSFTRGRDEVRGDAFIKGKIVIWGLTFRILDMFFSGKKSFFDRPE